jgi:hypothetical protein
MATNQDNHRGDPIHRYLRDLPELEAPPTLLPRVLEQIRLRAEVRWWRRPWAFWPPHCRAMLVLATLSAVAVVLWGQYLWHAEGAQALGAVWTEQSNRLNALLEVPVTLLNGFWAVARNSVAPFWLPAAGLLFAMYLTCVGVGTACVRVAYTQRTRVR